MKNNVKTGDLVKSLAGRDKEKFFLVVKVEMNFAFIVDGKVRKTNNLKKKNLKHLEKIQTEALISTAERINSGKPISNKKVQKAIKTAQQ